MIESERSPENIIWPADRFYWALLDTSVLPKRLWTRQPRTEQLGYLFEPFLPIPIDEVHPQYARVDEHQYIACGLAHSTLKGSPLDAALTLGPESLPDCMPLIDSVDPKSINLLVGSYEPPSVIKLKRHCATLLTVVVCLTALIFIGGTLARTQALRTATVQANDQRRSIYEQQLDAKSLGATNQPASVQLTAELRRLKQTRSTDHALTDEQSDASLTLQSLLAGWPSEHRIRTESISIAPNSITMVGSLPSNAEAQGFIASFMTPKGWTARQPQIQAVRDDVRLTWRLLREHPTPEIASLHLQREDRQ